MRRLADAGLTTREACGNSVRNITACPYAGVAADEAFDVTPYAEALTRYLLRHPLSSALPRKFKIAFEGCADDHAVTAINDIGWRARVQIVDGVPVRGFRVTVGRRHLDLCEVRATSCTTSCPRARCSRSRRPSSASSTGSGDYKHKQKNRMKFLVRALGFAVWRAEFEKALAEVRDEGGVPLPLDPERPPVEAAPDWPRPAPPSVAETARARRVGRGARPRHRARGPDAARPVRAATSPSWQATNVRPQKQDGYALVTVTVPSAISPAPSSACSRISPSPTATARCASPTTRTCSSAGCATRTSRTCIAGSPPRGLGLGGAGTLADVTSCPGAEACRLAVTQSRGLGKLLGDHLRERPDLVAAVPGLDIKISGCPNGCGQHHIAGLGFQGSVRKVGDKAVPQYFVMLGGGVDDGRRHVRPARREGAGPAHPAGGRAAGARSTRPSGRPANRRGRSSAAWRSRG